mgnify:CR=1 FL=1
MSDFLNDKYLNDKKWERAVKACKDAGLEANEVNVDKFYLQYGGVIAGDPSTFLGVPENLIPKVEEFQKELVVEKKSKHKGKK